MRSTVMLGVGLQRFDAPLMVALGVAALALPVIANIGSRFTARVRLMLTVALLLCPLAWWRANAVRNAPDVLSGSVGQTVTLEGEFDGRFLNAPDARVLIQPRRALQSGRYRVTGRLELPSWYRNPGAFDLGAWLELRGVRYALRVQKSVRLPDTLLERVRRHARAGVTAGLPPTEAALMLGVALGDADDFSSLPDTPEGLTWREVFSKSGLAHVMALSGQQITLLVAALSLLLARLKLWRYPALITVLGAYLIVVGFSPSVTRAVLMGVAVLASLWLGRGKLEVTSTLGLSAVLTLSLEPRWLFDLGWQLSFLAVLGMMLFTPPILALFPKVSTPGKWLIGGIAATLGASALTLPLTASSFGVIAPFSVFANLVAEVLMTALVPLGFLASLGGETIGALVNLPTRVLATALLETARVFSVAPVLPWGSVGVFGFVAFYASIAALLLTLRRSLRVYQAFAVVLLGVIVTGAAGQARGAQILYLDVGQGDSTLIRLPGADILVDGGGTPNTDFDIGKNVVVPALRALGVRNLIVIATHADSDHVEGLEAVLDELPVSTLVIGHDKVPGTARVLGSDRGSRDPPPRADSSCATRRGLDARCGTTRVPRTAPQRLPGRQRQQRRLHPGIRLETRVVPGRHPGLARARDEPRRGERVESRASRLEVLRPPRNSCAAPDPRLPSFPADATTITDTRAAPCCNASSASERGSTARTATVRSPMI
ncbi:MAG: DUF4131 domain-containing protein [Pleurocapsa sp. SU_196_0]|nr:DUF4131 domain-containing protein [Pleurocapsa sp. SU_196_0]